MPEIQGAQCCLASSIGRPITDPHMIDVQLELEKGARVAPLAPKVRSRVRHEIEQLPDLWRAIVQGAVTVLG